MAFILVAGGIASVILGSTIGLGLRFAADHNNEADYVYNRDVAVPLRQALLQVDVSNLRGRDWEALQGLTFNLTSADSAIFNIPGVAENVPGNITISESKSVDGMIHGSFVFPASSIQEDLKGYFATYDQSSAGEKLHDKINKTHHKLSETRNQAIPCPFLAASLL